MATGADAAGNSRGWYATWVLTAAYLASFVDRSIISLLIEPIKADLGLSDTQIALIQGLAFGIFFAAAGLPMGWLADRMSRGRLLICVTAIWSLATACSGLAIGFATLFACRLVLGVAEAGLSPAALSIISDSFPANRRGLPIAVYTMAGAWGAGAALLAGGAILTLLAGSAVFTIPAIGLLAPWQAAFLSAGLGSALIVPFLAFLSEPARERGAGGVDDGRLGAFLRENRRFVARHFGGVAIYGMATHAVLTWTPSMFVRDFGWSSQQAGLNYGLLLLLCGGTGPLLGAGIARTVQRRGRSDAAILVTGGGMIAAGVLIALSGLMASVEAALWLLGPGLIALTLPTGTAALLVQDRTPSALRGRVMALFFLLINLVGFLLGPLSVALLTDHAFAGPRALGHALGTVTAVGGLLSGILCLSLRTPAPPSRRTAARTISAQS